MRNEIKQLLYDENFTNLTLLICTYFKKHKIDEIDKVVVSQVHNEIKSLKEIKENNEYLIVSDRQLKNDYTKGKIKNEIERLKQKEYLYFNGKIGVYDTFLNINSLKIYEKCWFLFMNGTETTKNSIKYILQQMIELQSQDIEFSKSKLLKWIKENTNKTSITGSEYSKTLKLFKDEEFLEYINKNQYLVNIKYIHVKI